MKTLFHHNSFKFCPNCSANQLEFPPKSIHCLSCNYVLYLNTAASVGLVIWRLVEAQPQVLLVSRALEPQKHYYDLPGGFVDPEENLEQALQRELREELGPELLQNLSPTRYLLSASNNYHYKQIIYPVCDAFFHAQLLHDTPLSPADDVESYLWLNPNEIAFAHLAFPSTKLALQHWLALQN